MVAVNEVDLTVAEGAIHGIIGPNGAGKTTLFNAITGLAQITSGEVAFRGGDISKAAPHRRARMGIRRTFQSVQLIPQFTTLENVLLGLHGRIQEPLLRSIFGFEGRSTGEEAALRRGLEMLEFLGIPEALFKRPTELSFAQQRYVEIGRALVARPTLLMLDEPAAGLSPNEVADLNLLLRRIRADWAVTIILVEHVLSLVLDVSDQLTVLENGGVIAEGTPGEIEASPRVKMAYLGDDHA